MVYFKEDGLKYTLKPPKHRGLGFLFLILVFLLIGLMLYQDFTASYEKSPSSISYPSISHPSMSHSFINSLFISYLLAEEYLFFVVGFLVLGGLFIIGLFQIKKPRLTIDMAELSLKGYYGFKSFHLPLMTLYQFAIYPAKKGKEEHNQLLFLRVHYFKDEAYFSQTLLQGEKEKLSAILDEIAEILTHYRQSLKGLAATQIFLDKIPPSYQKPLKTLSLHQD